MKLSARNQLSGTVTNVEPGAVMAEVTVDVDGQQIVSAITRASAERLGLADGRLSLAVFIKATEVMLGVDDSRQAPPPLPSTDGLVSRLGGEPAVGQVAEQDLGHPRLTPARGAVAVEQEQGPAGLEHGPDQVQPLAGARTQNRLMRSSRTPCRTLPGRRADRRARLFQGGAQDRLAGGNAGRGAPGGPADGGGGPVDGHDLAAGQPLADLGDRDPGPAADLQEVVVGAGGRVRSGRPTGSARGPARRSACVPSAQGSCQGGVPSCPGCGGSTPEAGMDRLHDARRPRPSWP